MSSFDALNPSCACPRCLMPHHHPPAESSCQIACDAANRWLDNLEALRGWLRKRFEGKGPEIDELFREVRRCCGGKAGRPERGGRQCA